MTKSQTTSLAKLISYCESQNYVGWDPYDGLNSKLFNRLPLKQSSLARLAWIQFFKRSPINFRPLFQVDKGHNPKGLGLFLSGYSKILLHQNKGNSFPLKIDDLEAKVHSLAELLLESVSKGYSGACWGYNFDWQARGGLHFPAHTPTVVATTYAAYGLLDAYEATKKMEYLDAACDAQNFVLNDLRRDYRDNDEFLFSYSVLSGNNKVYNASLLGSKLLARIYSYTSVDSLLYESKASVDAVIRAQNPDGSWMYGEGPTQGWIDSFHTGFNLEALSDYARFTGDESVLPSMEAGFEFYTKSFFTTHALKRRGKFQVLADRVLAWTIQNMQSNQGYFYYQKKPLWTSKIPFMRWSQAWMMHALTVNILASLEK